jgi:hypothetical protein
MPALFFYLPWYLRGYSRKKIKNKNQTILGKALRCPQQALPESGSPQLRVAWPGSGLLALDVKNLKYGKSDVDALVAGICCRDVDALEARICCRRHKQAPRQEFLWQSTAEVRDLLWNSKSQARLKILEWVHFCARHRERQRDDYGGDTTMVCTFSGCKLWIGKSTRSQTSEEPRKTVLEWQASLADLM